ncbi:hypothetical protein LZ32DRAFT_655763 [Colletotrichum eremochloae]|nr:hypothetical protein LZ32DRAFT_655763 [Colletotrichum eremochloae]
MVKRASAPLLEHQYIALSYVWGDLQDVEEVILEHIYRLPDPKSTKPGICFQQPFNITRRLARALRSTRWAGSWVWVDSISINQYDLKERASQVSIMGNIYAEATFVLIWLDETKEEKYVKATQAMEKLSLLVKDRYPEGGDRLGYQLLQDDINNLFEMRTRHHDDQILGTEHLYCDFYHTLAELFDESCKPQQTPSDAIL